MEQHTDTRSGLRYCVLPAGHRLFKGMPRTRYTVADPRNKHAAHLAWFSSHEVAATYAVERGGFAYEFTALRPLKLLVIHDENNLKYIYDRAAAAGVPRDALDTFRATTGYATNLDEQAAFFEARKPGQLLVRRPPALDHTEKGGMGELAPPHRVSVGTAMDRVMAGLICRFGPSWLDGYIGFTVPTAIVLRQYPLPFLQEEVCLCTQKDNIEVSFGGEIPDALGLQGGVKLEDGRALKYFLDPAVSAREWRVSQHLAKAVPDADSYFALWESRRPDGVLERVAFPEDGRAFLLRATEEQALRYVAYMLKALDALEAAGVLHWDLNPGNVLVTAEGLPRIADFGTAQFVHDPGTDPAARVQFAQHLDRRKFLASLLPFAVFRRMARVLGLLKAQMPAWYASIPSRLLRPRRSFEETRAALEPFLKWHELKKTELV
jgi:hypothetical protein